MSRRSDDADLTHWCRRSAYLDQVRSLRTIEAAARLSDPGEGTGWHRNSGQTTQMPEKTSASNREAIQSLVVPYME